MATRASIAMHTLAGIAADAWMSSAISLARHRMQCSFHTFGIACDDG
jgi:hypothetical protein